MEITINEDEEYDAHPVPLEDNTASKRRIQPEKWKRNQDAKRKREQKNEGCRIACAHTSDNKFCNVRSIPLTAVLAFYRSFWENDTSIDKRKFLLKHISVSPVNRVRTQERERTQKKYFILCTIPYNGLQLPIRRESFLSVLSINRSRLETAGRAIFDDDLMKERRGGSVPSLEYQILTDLVIEHICSLRCREKHYGKITAFNRMYLPEELNVKKLHSMFLERNPSVPCTYNFYHKIFRTKFNIGFGSLKIDTCSVCEQFRNRIKEPLDADTKKMIVAEQMLHKFRARRFFQELNSRPETTITINFDLMQNQPLPRTQIGEAYYARQLWYYMFAVVIHDEKKSINKDTVFFYR